MDVRPADILVMKKPHPCGEKIFEITRVGMDVKLRCDSCGYGFQAALHGLRQGIHGAAKQDRTANQTDSERSPRIVTYRSACRYIS